MALTPVEDGEGGGEDGAFQKRYAARTGDGLASWSEDCDGLRQVMVCLAVLSEKK